MLLATAGDDIRLWDCSGYSLVKQYNPHAGNLSCVRWTHDNSALVSSSTSGDKLVISQQQAGAGALDIAVDENRTCFAINSTSRYIVGGGADSLLHIWDLKTHKLKKSYKDHKAPVTCVQFSWNDTCMASGSESGEIILHSVVTGVGYRPLVLPKAQAVQDIQYSHFKKALLASASDYGTVALWDTSSKRLVQSFTGMHQAPATSLAFSPFNDMLLVSVGLDKRIVFYDVIGKTVVQTITVESPLTSVALHHDCATLAAGSTRGKVYIYDLRYGAKPLSTLNAHKSSVQSIQFMHASGGAKTKEEETMKESLKHRAVSTMVLPESRQSPLPESRQSPLPARHKGRTLETDRGQPASGDHMVFSPIVDSRSFEAGREVLGLSATDGIFSPLRGASLSPARGSSAANANGASQLRREPSPSFGGTLEPGRQEGRDMDSADAASQGSSAADRSPRQDLYKSAALDPGRATPNRPRVLDTVSKGSSDIRRGTVITTTAPTPPEAGPSGAEPNGVGLQGPMSNWAEPPTAGTRGHQGLKAEGAGNQGARSQGAGSQGVGSQGAGSQGAGSQGAGLQGEQVSEGVAAIVQRIQPYIKNIVTNAMEDFMEQIHNDILNLHMEVLKRSVIQQMETERLLQQCAVNQDLQAEVERLREENRMLKKNF